MTSLPADRTTVRLLVVADKQRSGPLQLLFDAAGGFDTAVPVEGVVSHHAGTDAVVMQLDGLDVAAADVVELLRACAPAQVVLLAPDLLDPRLPARAAGAGRLTFLLDDVEPVELVRVVRAAVDSAEKSPDEPRLTPRERDVLALVATGLSNRAIGRRLGITESTVKAHLTKAYRALGVTTRNEALEWSHHQFSKQR